MLPPHGIELAQYLTVLIERAIREVQPEYINPVIDHQLDDFGCSAAGPESSYYLCLDHSMTNSTLNPRIVTQEICPWQFTHQRLSIFYKLFRDHNKDKQDYHSNEDSLNDPYIHFRLRSAVLIV